jgi:hypothetical protein
VKVYHAALANREDDPGTRSDARDDTRHPKQDMSPMPIGDEQERAERFQPVLTARIAALQHRVDEATAEAARTTHTIESDLFGVGQSTSGFLDDFTAYVETIHGHGRLLDELGKVVDRYFVRAHVRQLVSATAADIKADDRKIETIVRRYVGMGVDDGLIDAKSPLAMLLFSEAGQPAPPDAPGNALPGDHIRNLPKAAVPGALMPEQLEFLDAFLESLQEEYLPTALLKRASRVTRAVTRLLSMALPATRRRKKRPHLPPMRIFRKLTDRYKTLPVQSASPSRTRDLLRAARIDDKLLTGLSGRDVHIAREIVLNRQDFLRLSRAFADLFETIIEILFIYASVLMRYEELAEIQARRDAWGDSLANARALHCALYGEDWNPMRGKQASIADAEASVQSHSKKLKTQKNYAKAKPADHDRGTEPPVMYRTVPGAAWLQDLERLGALRGDFEYQAARIPCAHLHRTFVLKDGRALYTLLVNGKGRIVYGIDGDHVVLERAFASAKPGGEFWQYRKRLLKEQE